MKEKQDVKRKIYKKKGAKITNRSKGFNCNWRLLIFDRAVHKKFYHWHQVILESDLLYS